jgi:hypothetical protein
LWVAVGFAVPRDGGGVGVLGGAGGAGLGRCVDEISGGCAAALIAIARGGSYAVLRSTERTPNHDRVTAAAVAAAQAPA